MHLRAIRQRNKDGAELAYVRTEKTLHQRKILSGLDIPESPRFLAAEPA
jgi:hypothetical protein